MINILLDGFSSFQNHFWIVFCILLMVIWGQIVMQKMLSKVFDNSFTEIEYFSLSLSGWILPVLCWAVLYFVVVFLFGEMIAVIFSVILFLPPFFFIKFKKPSRPAIVLILFLLVSILLRLAFLQQAILPSYFDSAEHYINIQNLLSIYKHESFSLFRSNYYHLGYHFISAALIHLFHLNIIEFMLVFGQMVLAVLPIPFFFLLKQIAGSNEAAFFACLVAGLGFHMPAHLINWGKYPTLLSLAGIQFILCLGYLVIKENISQSQRTKIYLLIIFSLLITILFHTRALIVFAFMTISYFCTLWLKLTSTRFQFYMLGLVFLAIGVEVFYIQQSSVLFPLFERYSQNDVLILILVLLLAPFSIKSYPNPTFFLPVSLFLFILSLFFPIQLFDYGIQTLLDRPYVQMLMYLPFSMLASLGFAGFMQIIQSFSKVKVLNRVLSFVLFGFVLLNAQFNQDFYLSECCQLASRDDLSAIAWIEKNIPLEAKVLISATQLYVTSYEQDSPAATDAGIWIKPLTSRDTHLEFIEINFKTFENHLRICSYDVDYIYVGNMPQSFNEIQLASQPSWYQPAFLLPKAQVYQMIGCD